MGRYISQSPLLISCNAAHSRESGQFSIFLFLFLSLKFSTIFFSVDFFFSSVAVAQPFHFSPFFRSNP